MSLWAEITPAVFSKAQLLTSDNIEKTPLKVYLKNCSVYIISSLINKKQFDIVIHCIHWEKNPWILPSLTAWLPEWPLLMYIGNLRIVIRAEEFIVTAWKFCNKYHLQSVWRLHFYCLVTPTNLYLTSIPVYIQKYYKIYYSSYAPFDLIWICLNTLKK